ncbi:hypothetical protein A3J98_01055 [candidate division WS6 bacterium RIFOXYC1_FULL_33_10]|uniref:Uncharacterized protein n=1 Tax=candidate division WS6 bacterium RIFOXYC1_FULL_33_10 TaxID=1802606 RepID=A0A1F4UQ18_9BACT|nr:MAG: hypothetical protein A3J98_01055 [candidate division WS6 bacterium RIFOXYC1_FULL_33_10]
MRQHAIPQNVLDVEFKLFTKFTLREFTYLAIGVSIGGIFLYYTTKGQIPGVIGIPIFAIFAGLGAFFALVPINDQPADKFIVNYFAAINKPTQRVWLNKALKDQRSKPTVAQAEEEDIKVIGGAKIPVKKVEIFQETPGDDILDERNAKTILENAQKDTPQEQEVPVDQPRFLDNTDNVITITDDNISRYQFPIKSIDKLPGNINIWLATKENQPLTGINTYLKDINGKILYGNKTGPNGYFLTNKEFPEGVYHIEFEGLPSKMPNIRFVRSKDTSKLPLKITLT